MLVLSRKVGERILIGDKISVTVVRANHGAVRIGIEAPSDMLVVRAELQEAALQETESAANEKRAEPPSTAAAGPGLPR
jgi:carbon storage regulator